MQHLVNNLKVSSDCFGVRSWFQIIKKSIGQTISSSRDAPGPLGTFCLELTLWKKLLKHYRCILLSVTTPHMTRCLPIHVTYKKTVFPTHILYVWRPILAFLYLILFKSMIWATRSAKSGKSRRAAPLNYFIPIQVSWALNRKLASPWRLKSFMQTLYASTR